MVLFLNDKKPTASYSQGQAFSFYYKKGQTKSAVGIHSGQHPVVLSELSLRYSPSPTEYSYQTTKHEKKDPEVLARGQRVYLDFASCRHSSL